MPKVTGPLFSLKARGQLGKALIFKRGGIVVNYFKPRNPNSAAQQAQREIFKELYTMGLTQEQADLLYAAILHEHDDLYSALGHLHDERYAQLAASDPFTQYLNQTRGDARYAQLATSDPFTQYLNQTRGDARYVKLNEPLQWIAPTLLNSWVNYGAGTAPAGYCKDQFGILHIRGYIKSGANNTTAFVLPEGYRPSATDTYLILTSGVLGWLNILPDGSVKVFGTMTQYALLTSFFIL